MYNLSDDIKEIAIDIGFHKIGISSIRLPEKNKLLEPWLIKKYHGTMEWMVMNKDKRMDIQKFFPGAQSIICVAHNYFTPFKHSNLPDKGKISRYAWGEDYHKIMKKMLKSLLQKIKDLDPSINGHICVDTSPIMEKLWAEQAGLGWQGKHTNIITKEYGSWIFLGELIVDKELSFDRPMDDFCGNCQACLQACPTNALIKPYVLDSSKCISYLTIEYKDKPIPADFKKNMKQWIFGCDACQDVCPWNKFQKETSEKCYFPREKNINPDLEELSTLNEVEYRLRFKRSPVLRAGLKNLVRNARAVRIQTDCKK